MTDLVSQHQATMMLAESEEAFEAAWNDFIDDLENRGHWTELKAEWQELYQQSIAVTGEW